jgi:hypothetical protein
VRVVQLSDTQVLEYRLIENAIREDVHPYEEAMAYKALLETSEPRYDVASIAAKIGEALPMFTASPGGIDSRCRGGISGEPDHGGPRRFDRAFVTGAAEGCACGNILGGLANEGDARCSGSRVGAVDSRKRHAHSRGSSVRLRRCGACIRCGRLRGVSQADRRECGLIR